MSLSTMLRGATRCTGLVRSVSISPLKAYSTIVAGTHRQAAVKTLSAKCLAPVAVRNISVSAPRRMASAEGSHTALWTIERIVSAALVAVIPAAFLYPSQALDGLLAVSVVLHAHWGVEAMVVDYLRPSVVGNVLPKVVHVSLILLSIATLGGLFYLIKNDVGLAKGIQKLWAIKGKSDDKA